MPYSKFTGLSKKLWLDQGQKIFHKITNTPLVKELIVGLPPEKFHRFTIQDICYLEQSFQPVMRVFRDKTPDFKHKQLFSNFIAGTEIELTQLKKKVYITHKDEPLQPSKVCEAYGNYLLETAINQPYETALVSLLPCFTFFPLIGLYIKKHVNNLDNHPQADWIKVYAEELFDNAHIMANLISDKNRNLSIEEEQNRIMQYTIAANHELCFFKDALSKNEVPSCPDIGKAIDTNIKPHGLYM